MPNCQRIMYECPVVVDIRTVMILHKQTVMVYIQWVVVVDTCTGLYYIDRKLLIFIQHLQHRLQLSSFVLYTTVTLNI